MDLTEHFQKYVGRLVEKLHNIHAESTVREIEQEAQKYGLRAFFEAQGRQNELLPEGENLLRVSLVDDGVPANKQGWGWRIAMVMISRPDVI